MTDLPVTINRRKLLQAAGLSAGTLFLPSLIGDKQAYAQGAPKRIVFFLTDHGPVSTRWNMTRPGLPATGDWEFPLDDNDPMSFSKTLRPLHAHRKDLMILDGLAYTSSWADDFNHNHHGLVVSHRMAGSLMGKQGPSVDQIIANKVKVPGRFPYLFYAAGSCDCWSSAPIFDLVGKQLQPGRICCGAGFARGAFDRIFGTGVPAPGGMTGPLKGIELSRARRKSVLGLVGNLYPPLLSKLGGEDRAKVERHRDMIAQLEKQIVELSQIKCEKPTAPAPAAYPDAARMALSQMYPVAMACDLTRVAILGHPELAAGDIGAPATNNLHQEIAHMSSMGAEAGYMENYYALHAQQFADMVQAFKSVPEGNGTMLDNSLLVWMPEHGNGWHDHDKLMTVVAGSGGGAFRTGRYIKWGATYKTVRESIGAPHSRFLVSLARAMGADVNSVGEATANPNGKYLAQAINLSGPLDRLT